MTVPLNPFQFPVGPPDQRAMDQIRAALNQLRARVEYVATLGGGGGGGTTITTGTSVVDFGAFPGRSDASVVVTGQTGITAGSVVQAWLEATATADHTADEHRLEPLAVTVGDLVAGTGFTIRVHVTSDLFEPLEPAGISRFRSAAGTVYGNSGLPSVGGLAPRAYGQWTVRWQWFTP